MHSHIQRLGTRFVVAVVGCLLAGCSDPAASPRNGGRAGLAIAPVLSANAATALSAYRSAGVDADRVHITILRPPAEVLADQSVTLAGRGQQFTLEFEVQAQVGEVLTARVEFLAGSTALYAGSGPVVARALDQAGEPDVVTVLPVGPGATATRVAVSPSGGVFPTSAPVAFSARAFDQSNNEIVGALFTWSVDNTAVASINASGVVQPTALGGLLHVLATTLNGISGESVVTFATAGAASHLAIAKQPGGAVSGLILTTQPVIEIRDANEALVTTSAAVVTATVASGTGTLVGTTTVTAVNGVATFTNLRINGAGAVTLLFASSGLASTTSTTLTVTQTPASLAIQAQPGGATSGSPFTIQPVIRVLDNAGVPFATAIVVTAAITSGNGTLSGTTSVTTVGGLATFTNLAITGSGQVVLTFSTSLPPLQIASAPFAVTGTGVTHLVVATQPGGAVSGVTFTTQPVVEVRDANNALLTSFTGSVSAAIASGSGTMPGAPLSASVVNGIASFSGLRINGSGPHTLTFTATGATSVTSASFTVTQNVASLQIQTQPGGGTSGSPLPVQPVIVLLDNAGLVVSGSTLAVSATIASGNGTVVSGSPVNAVNGVATFTSLRVDGTGPQTLMFSTTNPALSVTSTGFALNAAPATQILIRTQPGGAVSGVAFTTQPVVEFRDANNAIVTGVTGSVLAQIASGTGTLVGNTSVNAVNGVATFTNLRINGSGPHTISFTAIGLPPVTSLSFTVTQTPASLFIRTQPAGSTSGSPLTIQPVVEIHDNANILIATSTLTVTATVLSSTNGATITAGASVAAVGGVATFTNLTMTGSGGVTLSFSIPSLGISIQAAPFAVNGPAGASQRFIP
jgi:hypothetical protein